MIEVKKQEYVNYYNKFTQFSDVIAVEAILLGYSKGKLYVDKLENPNVLLIWNEFDGFYLSLSTDEYILEA